MPPEYAECIRSRNVDLDKVKPLKQEASKLQKPREINKKINKLTRASNHATSL